MRKTKRTFTLIEILIAVALLTSFGALISVKTGSLLSHHKFHESMRRLKTDLLQVRSHVITDRSDATVVFYHKDGHYYYRIAGEIHFPNLSKPHCLSGVSLIKVAGVPLSTHMLHISYTGRVEPEETLVFQSKHGARFLNIGSSPQMQITHTSPPPKRLYQMRFPADN